MKCICHSAHLCTSQAAKTLPRRCEDLIRNIYAHFSHSAKRMYEFSEFQEFCETKPHKLLHVSQTRWLSFHMAVARLLEQWNPLKLYFTHKNMEDRLQTTASIFDSLNDPSLFLYITFINFNLPKFNALNLLFQRQEPTIHVLYNRCNNFYLDVLRLFIRRDEINKVKDITMIDPEDDTIYLPVENIYLGSDIHRLLQSDEYINREELVKDVRIRCRQFMITACKEIKKRFPLNSMKFKLCSIFSTESFLDESSRASVPTLSELVDAFPRTYQGTHQELDDEWKNIDNIRFPDNIKAITNPEIFFREIGHLKDEFGSPYFRVLPKLALTILSLPISNVDVERIFSKVNLIKTKTRNKLSTPTLTSLIIISEMVNSQGGCVEFEPSPMLINSLNNRPL